MGNGRRIAGALLVLTGTACHEPAAPLQGPAALSIVSGDGQEAVTPNGSQSLVGIGGVPDSLRVMVTDASGAPMKGVLVLWRTTAGSLSPTSSSTDSAGTAAARWSWYAAPNGFVPPGAYTATADVAGAGTKTFMGSARAGALLREVHISPYAVLVGASSANVTVTLRATDDRTSASLGYSSVQFYGPPTAPAPASWLVDLALASGTPADGIWKATVVVPAGTTAGDWVIRRVTLGWGCGVAQRISLLDSQLTPLNLPLTLSVRPGAAPAVLPSLPGLLTSPLTPDAVAAHCQAP